MKKSTAEYWAPRINAEWRKSVQGILNVGRQLIAAKEACEHGEFLRLFKGSENAVPEPVPFGIHTADRLMAIAAKPAIADCAHAHTLPQSWATLYELTKLDDVEITARIEAGEITPDMTRSQAAALRADPIERPESAYWTALREIENVVRKHEQRLAFSDRVTLVTRIRRLADHVEFGLTHPTPGEYMAGHRENTIERLRAAGMVPDDATVQEIANRCLENGFSILAKSLIEERKKLADADTSNTVGTSPSATL